jgi:tRNA(Ile)-lysidine synthase
MIKIQGKLPKDLIVACSGGVDSIAIAHFLTNCHNVTLAYFNHQTPYGIQCETWMKEWAEKYKLPIITSTLSREKDKTESLEEYWRKERYSWFYKLNMPVITAHHLDDCVETWIWSSMHGTGKIIPYRNRNIIRPFRLNEKEKFKDWAVRKELTWMEDPSNANTKYTRNYIRHTMMPHVLNINPGIKKVIRKKVIIDTIT